LILVFSGDSMKRVSFAPAVLLTLAACGGGGGGTGPGVSSASACGGWTTCPTATPAPTPAPTPTPTPGTPTPTPPTQQSRTYSSVADRALDATQVYTAIGATQKMREQATSELYNGEQKASGVQVSYDPRGATFTVAVDQASAGVSITYQDPAHRTAFGGALEPTASAPNSAQFTNNSVLNYLESGTESAAASDRQTFFYQQPGGNTRYVSLAGYLRANATGLDGAEPVYQRTRSVFAFGNQTVAGDVPTSGTGAYSGNMLASAAFNDTADIPGGENLRTRFEWISGTARVNVDFRAGTVTANFDGRVLGTLDSFTNVGPLNPSSSGQAFAASGAASFTADRRGFVGKIDAASLGTRTVTIAGSSLDGGFFGPQAAEVGGAFRIVGGVPDQRVDIIGAFTAAK